MPRVVVDVMPSERADEVAIVGCDYEASNWFMAYPAVANPGKEPMPLSHSVSKPEEPAPSADESVSPPPAEKPKTRGAG